MKKKKKRNNIHYSVIIVVGALLLFIVMIFRVSQLALSDEIDGVNLQLLASKRTTRTEIIQAKRGNIYSTDGDILAENVASYKLIAYLDPKRTTNENKPQHVIDKELTAKSLAPILGIEEATVLKYLSKENVYQTEFGTKGKGLTELVKNQIEALNLPGLDFIETYKRYYPKGQFASYVLGYAKSSAESEEIVGEMGIEKQFDSMLKGTDGYIKYQKDLKGYKIAGTPSVKEDATQGKDIYLTIDSNIQFFVEQALNNAVANYTFDWYTFTIADAKTGAILATANAPSFDPNIRNISNYLDILVSSPYEPGSTMKTFTYMAAMENNVYDGTETYTSGTYTAKDGTVIGDWNRSGWGQLTFDKGYAMSSNVACMNIINRHMNSLMLRQYFRQLGFSKKTGIELPNESTGVVNFKYETEVLNAGFGQGITTTPIQNIQAMTALTNGGMLLQPYIVEKIVDPETGEIVLENERTEKRRVASTETANKMLQLMDAAINSTDYPTVPATNFKMEGGQLIGKTGTAQIANPNGGGYLNGKSDVITSFSGVYPKDNPQVIIYASVKRPQNGSQKPLTTTLHDVVRNISKYYGNNDTNTSSIEITNYKLPNFVNKKVDSAKTILEAEKMQYQIIGNGTKIIKQTPSKDTNITNKDVIYLITNDENLSIPNTIGLSSKVAKELLEKMGVKVKLEGVGYVTAQSIPADTKITEGLEMTLTLQPKFSA
ncbi:MAG: penicillin-binding protein [Bacilli bacterium]|nr:penicillin-binding protein [Bacilli bacterium]